MDKEVLRKCLKAGYFENGALFDTEAGTPQGGIISPTLANLTLDGLERLLAASFKKRKKPGKHYYNPKVALVRYADDFIITGASQDILEKEVRPLVEQFMRERGLELSREKTCITLLAQGSTSSARTSANSRTNCSSGPPKRTPKSFWPRCGRAFEKAAD